jgi:hypothetical protein
MKMKRSNHPGEALILAAALCAFTPGLAAQSRDTPRSRGSSNKTSSKTRHSRARLRSSKTDSMP